MSGQPLKGISANQLRALKRLEESFRVSYEEQLRKQYTYRAIALGLVTAAFKAIRYMIRAKYGWSALTKSSLGQNCVMTIAFAVCLYFFINPAYRRNLFCATIYVERINFSLFEFNLRFCRRSRRLEIID